MSAPLVELTARDLSITYGNTVALTVPFLSTRGHLVAVIGHNGSGKSTLIKSILGLLAPKTGELHTTLIRGAERTVLVPEQHMAFSPETGAVFADVSVESYIKLWCRLKQNDARYYRRGGSRFIEALDIAPLLGKQGRELSKGQRRRVQSCVGFLAEPSLFLFDEPFDGLDIAQSNALSSIILEEGKRMSVLISSHRMEVVERIADTVIVLEGGRVLAAGSVEEVCASLCERSVVISHIPGELLDVVSLLRDRFPGCLVHSIGAQLCVTGPATDTDEAVRFLAVEQRCSGMSWRDVKPSLVDAMHYHLRRFQSPAFDASTDQRIS